MAWCERSRRGQRTRHRRIEASQELGTPWTLRDQSPDGDPDHQPQARRLRVLDRRERITDAGRGIARRMQKKHAKWGPGNRSASYYRRSRGTSPAGTRSRERSEANCMTSGWKSRRRRSPCGAVAISGSPRGDPRPGSPDVQALDGPMGTEPSRSGQLRGRATRRAVAKANGLTVEIWVPHEADSSGVSEMPRVFSL